MTLTRGKYQLKSSLVPEWLHRQLYLSVCSWKTVVLCHVREQRSAVRFRDHTIRALRASVPVADWITIAGSAVERSQVDGLDEGDVPEELARFEDSVRGVEVESWAGPLTLAAGSMA